ncbi:hypothetical protein GCM10009547_22470 [Sporichthya brevicatena]|uniref:Leucine-binding protein domain-containing protein n=1 Tax=Sporichthya brevicatena TaxID=171442 RepID=A0ABN1GU27_9ACTN
MRQRRAAALVAAVLSGVVLVSGCGTRVDPAEVRAGAQANGPVTLDQAALDQLREAAAAAANGAAAPAAPGAAGELPDVVGGATVPGSGTTGSPGTTAAPGSTTTKPGTTAAAPAAPADGGKCTTQGAPIALGQVGTFSGLAGPIAGDGLTAMAVWAKQVNARGGLACHPVTLYTRDDGGDPSRAAAATKDLIGRGVVAFVGNLTALTQSGFLPEIKKNCIPAIGIDFGAEWATEPCLFPQGGGWRESIAGLVQQAADRGHRRIGLLYCVEINTCSSIGKDIGAAAKQAGIELVYSSSISLTQTDYTAQCQNAKNAKVEELVVAMEGSAMARLARSCVALNYKPLLVGAAWAVNPKQAEDPQIRELGLAAVNPNAPWFATDQPGLREYQAALKTYAPQIVSSGMTLQMWSSGKILEAAVALLGPAAREKPLTADQILSGLGKIQNETLGGITAPLNYAQKGKSRSSGCVFVTLLGKQGWTAPNGSKPLCISGARDLR